jgi:hypothetical protein
VSLVGGPFALVVREGRRSQRAKQDALAQFPDSRALDPLRGRRIMGGSPELFREIALRERLEQTGVPGSARILSVTDASTDSDFPPEVDLLVAVTVRGRPAYRIARRDTVPRLAIGQLTDGRPLPVLVDRAQPDRLVIEWMAQPQTRDPEPEPCGLKVRTHIRAVVFGNLPLAPWRPGLDQPRSRSTLLVRASLHWYELVPAWASLDCNQNCNRPGLNCQSPADYESNYQEKIRRLA